MKGKTIKSYRINGIQGYDDMPFLTLYFTDGSSVVIEANYGGYSGRSEDEYRRYIEVGKIIKSKKTK